MKYSQNWEKSPNIFCGRYYNILMMILNARRIHNADYLKENKYMIFG